MVTIFTNVERQHSILQRISHTLMAKTEDAEFNVVFFNNTTTWSPVYAVTIARSQVVVCLWQGPVYECELTQQALRLLAATVNTNYAFVSTAGLEQAAVRGFSPAELTRLRQYILFSGTNNYMNLCQWLYHKASGNIACKIQLPQELVWQGIYHPQSSQPFLSLTDFLTKFNNNQPLVAILFARESWVWQDLAYIAALIAELDAQGLTAVAIFGLWEDNPVLAAPGISKAVAKFCYQQSTVAVAAVVNSFKVSLTTSSQNTPGFLQALNVPVIQAYNLLRPLVQWQAGLTGLNSVELSVNVVQPEFDGVIHGGVVSSKEALPDGGYGYLPVSERVAALAVKVKKWVNLRQRANADKKVAIIFHNYPPTNANIGSALGLDAPASVALLLNRLAAEGYTLDYLPTTGDELITALVSGVTNDRRFLTDQQLAQAVATVSSSCYKAWFDQLSPIVTDEWIKEWGMAPGDVFLAGDSLVIPGMITGNIMISLQPPRGFGEDASKILHSPVCPPPHHYLAFYRWLRDVWQADAVIHVGTHGSLEWLPGKNAGLSPACYPELILADLPNIYPYYVTIVGEGIQAKRRGAACLISHLCPPLSQADLYDDLAELEQLLDEYAHYQTMQLDQEEQVVAQIEAKIKSLHLTEDLPRAVDQTIADYILNVHSYVEELKHTQIKVGLHTLGQAPQNQRLVEYILALTRSDNNKVPSLPKVIAKLYGYEYYQLIACSGQLLPDGRNTYAQLADEIWQKCRQAVLYLSQHNFSPAAVSSVCDLLQAQIGYEASCSAAADLVAVLDYICGELSLNLAQTTQELQNILRALNGEYIAASPGGAPTNGRTDILPTGRNFYGVDPHAMPTSTAWAVGSKLAEQVIERYVAEEGEYPESIGMVLWSDSNMRTNGQCVAECLYLMGVRPVWQPGSRRIGGLEVISLTELQRPRIDVVARISGLFRDTMPSLVQLLTSAVALVAELDEPTTANFIKKHISEDSAELAAGGLELSTARQQAGYRVFGCPPGGYGAGVAALLESKAWQTVDDLADCYVRWSAHAYGSEQEGTFMPELFRKRLSTVAITIKNIDNHEVHLLNSDDFNAYCGGMNAAVQSIRGQAPRCYIGDGSDQSRTTVNSLAEEIRRVFRSESLNPKFIQGMRQHGYKGAADLAALVTHCYGWDATSAVMGDWMYEGLATKLALDPELQDWMRQVNPWALQQLTGQLLEAQRRGMWQAAPELIRELEQLYLGIEGELEDCSDC